MSNFVQKLWYLFHLKYKLNMIQCNNTGHLLVMKTKNCMLLKVWGISIRSSLIKKAKMHLNYWTKITNSSHSGGKAAESLSDQTLLESQFSQTQLRIEAWFLRECYTVVKWGHTEGIEREKTSSQNSQGIALNFWIHFSHSNLRVEYNWRAIPAKYKFPHILI